MKLEDIFEGQVAVATVWRKRGNTVERGRLSKFDIDLSAKKRIETRDEEAKPNSVRAEDKPSA